MSKDRHAFEFDNGVYSAKEGTFASKDATDDYAQIAARAINRIAGDFDIRWLAHDWSVDDIPTPVLDRIFAGQNFVGDVAHWVRAFIGRCIYDVGECDDWSVALVLCGAPCAGKTVLLKQISALYGPDDVGAAANPIESPFALSAMFDKRLIAVDDGDRALFDLPAFTNMVSGEQMSVPRRMREPVDVKWTAPFVITCNEIPTFRGVHADGIWRRLVIVPFEHTVIAPDPTLTASQRTEMPAFVVKVNREYRALAARCRDIRGMMPAAMTEFAENARLVAVERAKTVQKKRKRVSRK